MEVALKRQVIHKNFLTTLEWTGKEDCHPYSQLIFPCSEKYCFNSEELLVIIQTKGKKPVPRLE